jgi:hypothetical protein
MFFLKPHHIKFMIVSGIVIILGLGLYMYKRVAAQVPQYTVSGFIFYDMDFSSTITPGDPLYFHPQRPLVSFHLKQIDRYAANNEGYYRFRNIRPGRHDIETVPNPPYRSIFTFPGGGPDPSVQTVTVRSSDIQNLNFLVQPFPFRGKVYRDENANSLWEAGEPFVAGATVIVYRRGTSIGNFPEEPDRTISSAIYVPNVSDPLDSDEQYNYVIGGPSGSFTVEIGAIPNGCQVGSATTKFIDYEGYDERGEKVSNNFNPANFALIDTPDPNDPVCGTVVPSITPTITPTPSGPGQSEQTITGGMYRDDAQNYCQGGMSPISGSTITVFQNGTQVATTTTDSSGTYTLDKIPTIQTILTIAPIMTGYRIAQPVGEETFVPYNNYPFTLQSDKTINVCLTDVAGWFQTGAFDVRFAQQIRNFVPPTKKASIDTTYPSIFFSSTQDVFIPAGRVSQTDWKAEYEYAPNHIPEIGHLSYSYFESLIKRLGLERKTIVCTGGQCIIDGSIKSGIIELTGSADTYAVTGPGGKINVTGAEKRLIILSQKPVTITAESVVDVGSLFVLASLEKITIDRSIGEENATSTKVNLAGVFSSEKEIVLDGVKCNEGDNPDKKLNVAGTIITNAKNPFAKTGSGIIINRSLCALPGGDPENPVLSLTDRPDFIMAFDEEYKTVRTSWTEIYPD